MKLKLIITTVIIGTALLTGCTTKDKNSEQNISVKPLHATFAINIENVNEVVGDADYVFVAYVNEETGTVYKNSVNMETENGKKEISDPYTNYSITIIDNIKGKLKKNEKIDIQKAGGLSKDGSTYILYEDDELFASGKYYIMAAYAQKNGSLLVSGPNSSVKLEVDNKEDIVSSKEYKKYTDAFKNEVKTDRKRSKSIYEEN